MGHSVQSFSLECDAVERLSRVRLAGEVPEAQQRLQCNRALDRGRQMQNEYLTGMSIPWEAMLAITGWWLRHGPE
jgi:hypothetical protein